MKIYYFTYGSNIHPLRLKSRISYSKFIDKYKLKNYILRFNKFGQDQTAKCNIVKTGNPGDFVNGVIYQIKSSDLEILDRIEGLNKGYVHKMLNVKLYGKSHQVLTYVAMPEYLNNSIKPYSWYKEMVIKGLEYYQFESDNIDQVRIIEAINDPDLRRNASMWNLIKEMEDIAK